MMMEEFETRTGFEPTPEEYEHIEDMYYTFDGDKEAFCKKFVEDGEVTKFVNMRARLIRLLKDEIQKKETEFAKVLKEKDSVIAELQKNLDKELEWKPCDTGTGTSFPEEKYQELLNSGAKVLSDEEAKEKIHAEFGFDPAMINIVHEVHTYEINKYHRIREKDRFERKPLYGASDWNYIRFDCAGWCYEMINGGLGPYNS